MSTNDDDWEGYLEKVKRWKSSRLSVLGSFSFTIEEKSWLQTCAVPLPDQRSFSTLKLPLCIHLARGGELGCDMSEEDCRFIVIVLNRLWLQAGIIWELTEIMPLEWQDDPDGSRSSILAARESIWSLHRDVKTGAMMNKGFRRDLFLQKLLPDAAKDMDTFDVYIFDFIGHQSQGCCISRETHTIVLGARSTKGYAEPTLRPLPCLAKTCAHELGHALGLGHPRGQCFADGTPQTLQYGSDNLMTGGKDSRGGGGEKLEDWQILVARDCAETFLSKTT